MGEKYLIDHDELVNIAKAIRQKNNEPETNKMSVSDMPTKIANLTGEAILKLKDYPDYVREEVLRVANLARTKINKNTIVSLCTSDTHYPAISKFINEYGEEKWDAGERTKSGVEHALMAFKALTHILPVDFIAHLGDVAVENVNGTTPTALFKKNLNDMFAMIDEVTPKDIPLFIAVGNHDAGAYTTPEDASDIMTPEFIFNNFTARAKGVDNNKNDPGGGGYCYRDLPGKNIRVFLLNSCENSLRQGDPNITTMPTN
jgi:hypothetical protein